MKLETMKIENGNELKYIKQDINEDKIKNDRNL